MARKSTACLSVGDCDGIAIALELCAGINRLHPYNLWHLLTTVKCHHAFAIFGEPSHSEVIITGF
jgi:hypothetical protein